MSRIAAFFDMDRTVVRSNTGRGYMLYAFRHGRVRRRHFAEGLWYALLYKMTVLDIERAMQRALNTMVGTDEAELTAFCRRWFEEEVVQEISSTARRVIEQHRRRGDLLVLLTGSSVYAARPLGEHLALDHVLATAVEVEGGLLTGRPVDPPCVGPGKVVWAEHLAAECDIDLDQSTFYTDSIEDIPMLQRVGSPVAVNPDFRLSRLAKRRGWRIERWV